MIKVTTADGLIHYLDSVEAIADISSPNTHAAVQAAYDEGNWEPYDPPSPDPAPPKPDWDAFNAAIMTNPRLNVVMGSVLKAAPAIAVGLPSALAQVSTQGFSAFEITFNALCTFGGATKDDRNTWAELAMANHLPSEFIAIVRGNAD